ncbi:MAG: sulfatase [Bacteroidales bacterium]|nr:sulfatase [Bacteroidales bacterium]MDT8372784.1 sulfatase [Bacteroidales bacterium]
MKRLTLLLFAVLGIAQVNVTLAAKGDERPVNVILIYLDDMGYGDLSMTGSRGYTTPNIDRMADRGLFFSHYYSPQAVCSASRAGLMTGCYPNRVGFSGALDHRATTGINEEEETIAELLKKRGYKTAIYGKWHLGCQEQFLPLNHGFDEFYGIPYSHDMWPWHPHTRDYYPPLPLIENKQVVATNPDHSQFTLQFTNRAIEFIHRNSSKPFFIYLAHPLPHVPLGASEAFKRRSEQGLYGDVMMEIDWSVGEIMKTLRELDLERNTLVIFTSDNGPWINYGNHAGSTAGLREGKGTTFEGGQRVPCIMWWEGTIPAGTVTDRLVAGIDILPTIVEATGAPLPEKPIDGVSLLPLLKVNDTVIPRKTFYYYYRKNNLEAVTDGRWKLVFPHHGRTYVGFKPGKDGKAGGSNENHWFEGGLYDLWRDPGERYDLKEYYPEILQRLERLAASAREDLGDDLTGVAGNNRREPGRTDGRQ